MYSWNETEVDKTDIQVCAFEPRPEIGSSGRARRMCVGHRTWREYDGGDCITELTFELQQLRVSCSNTVLIDLYINTGLSLIIKYVNPITLNSAQMYLEIR